MFSNVGQFEGETTFKIRVVEKYPRKQLQRYSCAYHIILYLFDISRSGRKKPYITCFQNFRSNATL